VRVEGAINGLTKLTDPNYPTDADRRGVGVAHQFALMFTNDEQRLGALRVAVLIAGFDKIAKDGGFDFLSFAASLSSVLQKDMSSYTKDELREVL
jgi:hypothetical protein